MPITEPISERIVQFIVTTLKTIKLADDFAFDVEVTRVDESGVSSSATNKGAAIEVAAKAAQRDEKLSYCGRDAYRMKVGILCDIRHAEESTTAINALQARIIADCHKALGPDPTCGGLAADMIPEQAQAGLDDRQPIADIMLDILFFTARNDPYSL